MDDEADILPFPEATAQIARLVAAVIRLMDQIPDDIIRAVIMEWRAADVDPAWLMAAVVRGQEDPAYWAALGGMLPKDTTDRLMAGVARIHAIQESIN